MSKSTQKTYNSSFWMGDWDDDLSYIPKSKLDVKSDNLYKLASYKRAIGNFVSIVTNQQIPVRFTSSGDSYTDGKSVTISSKIDTPKEFDVAVGLALHEGSHIKLSDFELLSQLDSKIGSYVSSDVFEKADKLGISVRLYLKMILNYVEDRRIDQYIYDTAPGYRDYYRALYDKYFNDPIIDKGLNSDEYTDETLESYMFRLINLHSEYSRLSALKNLRKIYEVIDLGNISRLKTSEDAIGVAGKVFQLIIEALDVSDTIEEKQPQQSQKSTDESEDSEVTQWDNESDDTESDKIDGDSDDSDEGEDDDGDNGGASMESDVEDSKDSGSDSKLTDKQKKQLDGKIKKQEDFINGKVSKKNISQKDLQTIKIIDESKTEIEVVGSDVISGGVQCIVVRKLTQSLMESSEFPYTHMIYSGETKSYTLYPYNTQAVSDGIRMGTILGKKLQTRSESRETVFNRQRNGRLDKRMVSSLGFGNEQVFFTKEVDKYKKANLHISIDASGSMGGSKWNKAITTAVALAKAVDMIPNLEIQISLRSTSKNNLPYIVMVYDSRVDKFSKVKSVFPYLYSTGTTPEGLTFEAIHKEMVPQSSDVDSYFLNFSDGEPYYVMSAYGYYSGSPAANHTYKQIKRMKQSGISVLSYFISEHRNDSNRIFSESYKDSASFVDVSNMNSVVKTMNNLFMKKDG
jgi:hypothetical protein